mmetsp:Transcript_11248/g.20378  ORF Transcript_11248/g.20378 Transcript_11248/m.20378 type:complete len:212 (-) Transcript_11248:1863-2498(-)
MARRLEQAVTKSMWSSMSLSNSTGFRRKPARVVGAGRSARIWLASMSPLSALPSPSLASASLAAILTPSLGVKSGTMTLLSASMKKAGSVLPLIPYISARRLAQATMKSKWFFISASSQTASASKVTGLGQRLVPLQNGVPAEVTWSGGKLCRSCLMSLLKSCSNLRRAQTMHSSNEYGLSSTRVLRILRRVSVLVFCWALRVSSKLGLER